MVIKVGSGVKTRIDFNILKELSKENRQGLNLAVRRDPELWNVLNGVGGLSEASLQGRLQGTISDDKLILTGAEIVITDANEVDIELKTNQYGYYSIDLVPGNYDVVISYDNEQSEEISVKIEKGVTSTLNHDLNEII